MTESIEQIGFSENATLFVVLLAGLKVLLAKLSNERDIVVGTGVAGRNNIQTENLIGFFVNTLALRSEIRPEMSFRELIAEVKKTFLNGYEREMPFELIIEKLNPERISNHSPLFQVMFVLQNIHLEKLSIEGLEIEPVELENETAKFDLTVSAQKVGEEIAGVFEFREDLFKPQTIERWIKSWKKLLSEVVKNPNLKIGEIDIIGNENKRRILNEWSGVKNVETAPRTPLLERLWNRIETKSDEIAIVESYEQISYGELGNRIASIAGFLTEKGVRAGDRIGIYGEPFDSSNRRHRRNYAGRMCLRSAGSESLKRTAE